MILLQAPSVLEIVLMSLTAVGLVVYTIWLFTKKKIKQKKPKEEEDE